MLVSAGCVQTPVHTENTTVDVPENLQLALTQYTDVVTSGFNRIGVNFGNLAGDLGSVHGNSSEVTAVLREYYAENPWASLLEYHPANGSSGVFVPDTIPQLISAVHLHHNESSFHGSAILRTGPFHVPEYGEVVEGSLPVYAADGTYCGYVSVFFDSGSLFRMFAREAPALSNYTVSVFLSGRTGSLLYLHRVYRLEYCYRCV